ncbi:hypothetical protein [Bacillus thuringiensis]|uniref:hypothetical protein n=1 Tax=Bacillus thuringiensis TaxID=1428 RepID=UPI000BEBFB34|nr:hypothetical protein [Bacillus thuringiensis]MDA2067823.1 hypothetical protein [Bacillus cereus]MDA2079570.1 hypothetical protein [Bacillus cereus]MDA2085127.1 hypothetical protein [Bacillus cereus]MDA2180151.1 hypothetical protein [Bacillus cereus]MED3476600.1 hypothetical protein [Bacillus thuringiensis]
MTVEKEKVTRRVVCRRCKSDQIVGNKRGYNFKRMFLILFLMLATLIAGLASIDNIIPIDSPLFGIAILIVWFIMLLGTPITLFSGFIGRKNIVNGCMNCGHTWMPKK